MKKDINFKNLESLNSAKRVLLTVDGLGDKINNNSSIPKVLGATIGIGIGCGFSFAALYLSGTVFALNAIGIAVLAAFIALLGVVGYGIGASKQNKKFEETKETMLQEIKDLKK